MKKITLENGKTVKISDKIYNNFLAKAATSSMPWRAEKYKKYWFLDRLGSSVWLFDERDSLDDFRYATGNYYRTQEEAQKEAERLHALGRVRIAILRANEGWKPDWYDKWQAKFEIVWDYEDNEFWFDGNEVMKIANELPYIASEEIAVEIIEDHEEDLKLIFGVE